MCSEPCIQNNCNVFFVNFYTWTSSVIFVYSMKRDVQYFMRINSINVYLYLPNDYYYI